MARRSPPPNPLLDDSRDEPKSDCASRAALRWMLSVVLKSPSPTSDGFDVGYRIGELMSWQPTRL